MILNPANSTTSAGLVPVVQRPVLSLLPIDLAFQPRWIGATLLLLTTLSGTICAYAQSTDKQTHSMRPAAQGATIGTTRIEEKFDAAMKAAQAAVTQKDHKTAYDLLIALEQQLLKADPAYNEKTMWAYLFEFKRFNAYEIGKKEEAYKTCETAIAKLPGSSTWAYLESHNIVRAAQRGCYNMLAWKIQENAKNAQDIEPAIKYIEACFDIKAPIESDNVHRDFFQARALIFLKAVRWGERKYVTALYETLAEAQVREIELVDLHVEKEDAAELRKVMASAPYLAYKKTHKWQRE